MKRGLGLGVGKPRKVGGEVIDPDAQLFFDEAESDGTPVTQPYISRYNRLFKWLKTSGQWTVSDSIYVWGTGNKVWALIDLKRPSVRATLVNDPGTNFYTDLGFLGQANFRILTNFNPGDGGTYNYLQNSCSFHLFTLNFTAPTNAHEISCCSAGYTSGIYQNGNAIVDSANNVFFPVGTYQNPIASSYHWSGTQKLSSTVSKKWENGVIIGDMTSTTSAIENKQIALMGAYNGSFAGPTFDSANCHVASVIGGNGLSQPLLMGGFNLKFFDSTKKSSCHNRVIFEGDSRTSDYDLPALNNDTEYPKKQLAELITFNTVGSCVGNANATIEQMITQALTQIDPYRNTLLTNDIAQIWAGTNDIADGQTAQTVYDRMRTWCEARKALGFKVIIIGEIDRTWSSYAAMNAVRAAYRTMLLADFSVSTAYSNVYLPTSGITYADAHFDPYALPNFQDASTSPWYQGDQIHPNSTGSDQIGLGGSKCVLVII